MILPGDEFGLEPDYGTVHTTKGYLSAGNHYYMRLSGDDGNDFFSIYSNLAELRLEGGNDNDRFIIRAFALADPLDPHQAQTHLDAGTGEDYIEYNINALLTISGGDGFDTVIAVGTEFADVFIVTQNGITGAGLNIVIEPDTESIEAYGMEGDDTFYIQSTRADSVTRLVGGIGSDRFILMGDIMEHIATSATITQIVPHRLAAIAGPLLIEGFTYAGAPDFTIRPGICLPYEDSPALSYTVLPDVETANQDELRVYNDDVTAGQTGDMSAIKDAEDSVIGHRITGFGLAGELEVNEGTVEDPILRTYEGIAFNNLEVIEILLGSGNDTFTISDTTTGDASVGAITLVHGGGGDDTITVTGRTGLLVVFGDTSEDGSRYASTDITIPQDTGHPFSNPGNDTINALGSAGSLVIYGGPGNDDIDGSGGDDLIAGGAGNDNIHGWAGDDVIYGDSDFNVSVPDVTSETAILLVWTLAVPTSSVAGSDKLYGDDGNDLIFGDHGTIEWTSKVLTAANLSDFSTAETTQWSNGAMDEIFGGNGDDILLGGFGGDIIDGGAGSELIIGDHGQVTWNEATAIANLWTYLLSVISTNETYGGDDTIYGRSGDEIIIGGSGADTIDADSGSDLVFGDHAHIIWSTVTEYTNIVDGMASARSIIVGNGGVDTIHGGDGDDILIGGSFGDTITSGNGNELIFGDNGRLTWVASVSSTSRLTGIRTAESIEQAFGGADKINFVDNVAVADPGDEVIIGGLDSDNIDSGIGRTVIFGDHGQLAWTPDNLIADFLNRIISAETIFTDYGAGDTINAGDGDDVIFGGKGNDAIDGYAGSELIFGDNGRVNWRTTPDLNSLLAGLEIAISIAELDGGDDTIYGRAGNELIIGGSGADTIDADNGSDLVFGDHAEIHWSTETSWTTIVDGMASARSIIVGNGGVDTIHGGDDDDILIGGSFGDTITSGNGNELIFGDNGYLTWVASINSASRLTGIRTAESIEQAFGGADWINYNLTVADTGDEVIIGGLDSDNIDSGIGRTVIFGDHGQLAWTPDNLIADFLNRIISAETIFTDYGAGDTINAGDGDNVIFGGKGNDAIDGYAGSELIFGDNGRVNWRTTPDLNSLLAGLEIAISIAELDGGDDTIYGRSGDEIIIGGSGADTIDADSGSDLVFGDHAHIIWSTVTEYTNIVDGMASARSIIVGNGGVDTIHGGDGDDILIGGSFGDTITSGNGNELIFGDNGYLTWVASINSASRLTGIRTAESIEQAFGGADKINFVDNVAVADPGDEVIIGGLDSDNIDSGIGRTVIFGDHGQLAWTPDNLIADFLNRIISAETIFTDYGAGDTINAGDGDDVIFGGKGNDAIDGYAGSELIFGDNGRVNWRTTPDLNSLLAGLEIAISIAELDGGDDTIYGRAGNELIIGGSGDDTIDADSGSDLVFGDHAEIHWSTETSWTTIVDGMASARSIIVGNGGVDTIHGGDDDDILIGGSFGDTITSGNGNELIFGDNGYLTWVASINSASRLTGIRTAESIEQAFGGADKINFVDNVAVADPGDEVIIGGLDSDNIDSGIGRTVIFGDHGQLAWTPDNLIADFLNRIISAETIFTDYGAGDTINAGDGDDVIFGGKGNDAIDGYAGSELIFGDNGRINWRSTIALIDLNGLLNGLEIAISIAELDGGDDTIYGRSGDEIIIGGSGADTIDADSGSDLVFGDHAHIIWSTVTEYTNIVDGMASARSIIVGNGGVDTIHGGDGDDILIGGSFGDTITSGNGNELIFGDNGYLTWVASINSASRLTGIRTAESIEQAFGGADKINFVDNVAVADPGDEVIIGGLDSDNIDSGIGRTVIFGDHGQLAWTPDNLIADFLNRIISAETIFTDYGAGDTINAGDGDDVIFGGKGNDAIDGYAGSELIFGDNGRINWRSTIALIDLNGLLNGLEIAISIAELDGGDDTIYGRSGDEIIIGGSGADTIDADSGSDLVFGDHAHIIWSTVTEYTNIVDGMASARSIIVGNGGVDTIHGGDGDDILIGGSFGDTITSGNGNELIFGDNGYLTWVASINSASRLTGIRTAESIEQAFGGADKINFVDNVAVADTGDEVIIGGLDSDNIDAGTGREVLFGDNGSVIWSEVNLVATFLERILNAETTYEEFGATDIIRAGDDDDIIFGGIGDDRLDGRAGKDLILGDNGRINRTSLEAPWKNPRFATLIGSQIYDQDGLPAVDPTEAFWPVGTAPAWGNFTINLTDDEIYGNDYIAGGADDDMIFGQYGNDTIQGDSSIDRNVAATLNADGSVTLTGSISNPATDGDDYIEGNKGTDLIFGNLGQDDIIGGSSDKFGLSAATQRDDGSDIIYGGSGDAIGRDNIGDTSTGDQHAADADTILGDNGCILRLVSSDTDETNTQNLTFTYDNYDPTNKLIVRAIILLDYTLGGSFFGGTTTGSDIGAADYIHGEAGDDTIYGMKGNDIIYGDGQDDDLIGGYGHDWISGGSGQDGILGDDGYFRTSRNGFDETLYGVLTTAATNLVAGELIATINVIGTLQKTAEILPLNIFLSTNILKDATDADDILYGGLGSDFIHGGPGDDAISGAEAPATYFNTPANSGNVLAYNPTSRRFADYNNRKPMEKIANFLLNFTYTEGSGNDGDDIIFGDTGNDWLVGGTAQDHLYGGWGDDLMNIDDNLDDVYTTIENTLGDIAFGGAGCDVMIASSTNDRMVDWLGEFNAYIVPSTQFGRNAIIRNTTDAINQFLYLLGQGDGSDTTPVGSPYGATIDVRFGEPYGELGLILNSDPEWGNQTGGPIDPQPGNKGGGKTK